MSVLNRSLFVLALASALFADDSDEFILRPAPGALSRVIQRYRLELKKSLPSQNLYLVKPIDDDNLEDHVRGDRDVVALEKNLPVTPPEIESGSTSPERSPLERALLGRRMVNYFGVSMWEGFVRQPAAELIGLGRAQGRSRTGSGTVAVIDTGVDPDHPALAGALVEGYDFTVTAAGVPNELQDIDPAVRSALTQSTTAFIDNSKAAVPINHYTYAALTQSTTAFIDAGKLPAAFGHGTMVASLIRLAAPTATIMPLKAFRADGSSNTFDILSAIYYAAGKGVKVINMSFNMKVDSPELARAIAHAASRRIVLVASAGNDGNEILVYPAAHASTIGVASVDFFRQRSGFSNYGSQLVSLSAPGEGVIVAYPGNNYASAWGTSFSTPLVAGAAALLVQRNPDWTPRQIEAELLRRTVPVSSYGLGAGQLYVGLF
jgi:subtilisin family serine protease